MSSINRADRSAVLSSIVSLSGMQAANSLLPLIVWPYLAKVLGIDLFGSVALAMAFSMYLSSFVDFGFNFTSTKEIAVARDKPETLRSIFFETLCAKGVLTIVALFFLLLLARASSTIAESFQFLLAGFLMVVASALNPTWFFQGLEKMFPIAVIQVMDKLIAVVLIFHFVSSPADALLSIQIFGLTQFFAASLSFGFAMKGLPIGRSHWPTSRQILRRLRASFDLFVDVFAPNLYSNLSVILLGAVSGMAQVAVLEVARKIVSILDQGMSILARALFPLISRNPAVHGSVRKGFLAVLFVSGSLLFLGADQLIGILFGEEFIESSAVLRFLIVGAIALGVKYNYGTLFLVPNGRTAALRQLTLISSIVAMVVAFILIPLAGLYGAVSAIVLGRFLQALGSLMRFRSLSSGDKRAVQIR